LAELSGDLIRPVLGLTPAGRCRGRQRPNPLSCGFVASGGQRAETLWNPALAFGEDLIELKLLPVTTTR
jgi:hypothetical protein